MKILENAKIEYSPNRGGTLLNPRFIVVHYTAGASAASSVKWLCSRQSKASAHLVIGRDGSITQLVPFDAVAWHAGESSWGGLTGLNKHSIGIELDNLGPLLKDSSGKFRGVGSGAVVAPEHVYTGKHANKACSFQFWHDYTIPQVTALHTVVEDLWRGIPSLTEIVGHDDIAPTRKHDPGPAASFMRGLKSSYKR